MTTTSGSGRQLAGRLDHPVDEAAAEQRVQVLRRLGAHARAEPGGQDDSCELRIWVTAERWLGRQDSNLGSRDQNPLPYHLATPQRDVLLPNNGRKTAARAEPDGL